MLVRMFASPYTFKSSGECDSFQWYEVLISIWEKKKFKLNHLGCRLADGLSDNPVCLAITFKTILFLHMRLEWCIVRESSYYFRSP